MSDKTGAVEQPVRAGQFEMAWGSDEVFFAGLDLGFFEQCLGVLSGLSGKLLGLRAGFAEQAAGEAAPRRQPNGKQDRAADQQADGDGRRGGGLKESGVLAQEAEPEGAGNAGAVHGPPCQPRITTREKGATLRSPNLAPMATRAVARKTEEIAA